MGKHKGQQVAAVDLPGAGFRGTIHYFWVCLKGSVIIITNKREIQWEPDFQERRSLS